MSPFHEPCAITKCFPEIDIKGRKNVVTRPVFACPFSIERSYFKNQNFEESRDKNIRNNPFEMEIRIDHGIRMSLSPIYTFKIRISERICLKGDEKLFEL